MSNLREELEKQKRNALPPTVREAVGTPAFIGFWPKPLEHVAFSTGQLLRYKLITRKPDLADDPTRPPQTLTLSFPTDDVVITGQHLDKICELLVKSQLGSVHAHSERFAELNPLSPFVTKIDIIPITKA